MKNEFRTLGMQMLTNGKIEGHEVEALRNLISADGKISEQEKKLLREIKGEAKEMSVEGQAFIEECLSRPANANT